MQRQVTRDFVAETRIGLLHARPGRVWTRVTFRVALLQIADRFDPRAHALGGWPIDAMLRRKAETLNGNRFANTCGIDPAIMQNDAAAERMADEANREIIDDVEERGEIQNMLGHAIGGAGRPSAVAVAAQIQRVDVIALAQTARYPVPIAGMVETAVNENQRRFVVLPIVPELQLEAVGIEEVRDRFHGTLRNPMHDLVQKIHGIPMVRQQGGSQVAVRTRAAAIFHGCNAY